MDGAEVTVAELALEAFVGVVGSFEDASDFVLATATETLSFLLSACKNNSKSCYFLISGSLIWMHVKYTITP